MERFHERYKLVDVIHSTQSNSAENGSWKKVENTGEIVAIINTGLIASGGHLDAKMQQANTAAGGGAKDITGAAITRLTATDDNQCILISVHTKNLDDGFLWVRLVITPASAQAFLGGQVFFGPVATMPAADNDYSEEVVI